MLSSSLILGEPLPAKEDWRLLGRLLPIDNNTTVADWALIEIENHKFKSWNSIAWEENCISKCLYPRRLAVEGPCDNDVVVATSRNGVLKGKISGTPSYMNLPRSLIYQEVWTVRLDQALGKSICWYRDFSAHMQQQKATADRGLLTPTMVISSDIS